MRAPLAALAALSTLVVVAACSGHHGRSRIEEVPLGRSLVIPGMDGTVEVVRDEYDQPHVYATTMGDTMRVLGWLHAEDRFIQMDLARRLGEGRLSELVGTLDSGALLADQRFRALGMSRAAQASMDAAPASELALLQDYTDGVNAWLATQTTFPAPEYALLGIPPAEIAPWTPLDSAVIGKLFAYELNWDGDTDLVLGQAKAALDSTFSTGPRAGTSDDVLFPFLPPETVAIVGATLSPLQTAPHHPHLTTSSPLPKESIDKALAFALPMSQTRWNPFVRPGHGFLDKSRGSNNWVVAPAKTADHHAIICNDPHLSLSAPSVWYPIHLNTKKAGGNLDVLGVSIAGDPAVVLGGNGKVGWAFTNTNPDTTDVYIEKYSVGTGAGGADQVLFNPNPATTTTGQLVDLQRLDEVIDIRTGPGVYTTSHQIVWLVPHRQPGGVIIPDSLVVATSGLSTAMSWRWAALGPTDELGALLALSTAQNAADVRAAASRWGSPVQNWVFADASGEIGYVANGIIPTRGDDDADLHTDPPQMPIPGWNGEHEWVGTLSRSQVPQEDNPARGWIATANQDPIGNTFDGDPYNDPIYLNAIENDLGFRAARIARVLDANDAITVADMQALQGDDRSNYGARMLPFLLESLGGTHPVETALLAGWRDRGFRTPAATESAAPADEVDDSAATSLFNVWMVFMRQRFLGDEVAAAGVDFDIYDDQLLGRLTLFLLEHPQDAATWDASTGESALWDDVTTPAVETRDEIFTKAFDDALAWLASPAGFSSTSSVDWRWGDLHRIIIARQSGFSSYDIPQGDDPANAGGFPRHSDMFAVDVGNGDWEDFDFHYGDGPSMREVMDIGPEGMRVWNVIPGGVSGDPESAYYEDQAKLWAKNQAHENWFREKDVARHGRTRDVFSN